MPDIDPDLERPDDPNDTARLKAVLVLVAAIAFVTSPFLAEPFTGFDPDQLAVPIDQPPVQPAGYAFSIWGLIYLWLLASAGYGLVKRDIDKAWDATRWPLFVSLAIGASWIAVALRMPGAATLLIWVMLAGAALALLRAPDRDAPWLALPLGLYAGWLTAAATVALATIVMGAGLLPPMTASWAGLALATALAIAVAGRTAALTYPLGVAWALIGVTVANLATAPLFAAAAAAAALTMGYIAYTLWQRRT